MADNTTLNSGSGGDSIATDDIGGVKYPRSKIVIGADGTNDGDVSSANPLPVLEANSTAILADTASIDTNMATVAGAVAGSEMQVDIVSGTVTANLSATDNAVLDAIAASVAGSLTVDAANDGSLNVQIGDGTNTATVRNLAANDALNVSIVDGSGNQVTSFGGSGGTSATDDSTFTAASGSGTPIMGFFSTDTVDANDVGVLAMDASRRLLVSIEADNAGIGGGTQYAVDAALGGTPTGTLAVGIRDDALSSLTPIEGDAVGLRVDANGALWTIPSGTVTVDGSGVTQPVSGTVTANLSATDNAVLDTIETNTDFGTVVGGGVEATALRVTLASDSTGVLSVDDGGGTLTVDGTVNIGGGGCSVDDGGGSLTVDGTVTANLSATDNTVLDNIDTNTSSATSFYRNIDANAEAAIKGSAGTLYWLHVINTTAAKAYLHLYNATTASVTPGTTTPDLTFAIPTQGDTNGAGFAIPLGPTGQAFSTAITLVCTTTLDGSTGDPGTNGVIVNAGYT